MIIAIASSENIQKEKKMERKQSRQDDATVNKTTEGNGEHSSEDTGCSENPWALTTAMKDSLKTFKASNSRKTRPQ